MRPQLEADVEGVDYIVPPVTNSEIARAAVTDPEVASELLIRKRAQEAAGIDDGFYDEGERQ